VRFYCCLNFGMILCVPGFGWTVVGIPTFAGVPDFVSFMGGNLLWSFHRGLFPRSTIGVGIAAMLNMASVLSARLPPM